jgi:hypothetical protein
MKTGGTDKRGKRPIETLTGIDWKIAALMQSRAQCRDERAESILKRGTPPWQFGFRHLPIN